MTDTIRNTVERAFAAIMVKNLNRVMAFFAQILPSCLSLYVACVQW